MLILFEGVKAKRCKSRKVAISFCFSLSLDKSLQRFSIFRRTILSNEFWTMMTQQGILNNGEVLDYASGLNIREYKGLKTISHGGSFVGFRAEFVRFPEQHVSIAIFANRADANPTRMAYQVADILLKENFATSKIENSNMKDDTSQKIVQLTTSELERFSGNYWNSESSLARKIYVKNDTLRYFRSARSESTLVPVSENEFKMLNVGSDVIVKFYNDDQGNKVMSFSQNDSEPSISKEYQPKDYSSTALLDFEGMYYSKELAVNFILKVKNDALTLYINDVEVTPLKEIMTNLFNLNGYGTIQFSTNDNGEISTFRLAAGRVNNLIFEKK